MENGGHIHANSVKITMPTTRDKEKTRRVMKTGTHRRPDLCGERPNDQLPPRGSPAEPSHPTLLPRKCGACVSEGRGSPGQPSRPSALRELCRRRVARGTAVCKRASVESLSSAHHAPEISPGQRLSGGYRGARSHLLHEGSNCWRWKNLRGFLVRFFRVLCVTSPAWRGAGFATQGRPAGRRLSGGWWAQWVPRRRPQVHPQKSTCSGGEGHGSAHHHLGTPCNLSEPVSSHHQMSS